MFLKLGEMQTKSNLLMVLCALYQSRAYYQETFLKTEGVQVIFDILQQKKLHLSLLK